jgi:hypothetical protein
MFAGNTATLDELNTTTLYVREPPVFTTYPKASTTISGSSHTMTADEALGGIYIRTDTGTLTDTFPSAASVVLALNTANGDVNIGDSFDLCVTRTAGSTSDAMTFTTSGTGCTLYGLNSFKGSRSYPIRFIITNVNSGTETIDIYAIHGNQ